MTLDQATRFSIDARRPSAGFFQTLKIKRKIEAFDTLVGGALNEPDVKIKLGLFQQVLEHQCVLGFYVPADPKHRKPAIFIKNERLESLRDYPRQSMYKLLNEITQSPDFTHDPALRNVVAATGRALLRFDFNDFLTDFVRLHGLTYSNIPEIPLSNVFGNRFPKEFFRLQYWATRYGLTIQEVLGGSSWSAMFSLKINPQALGYSKLAGLAFDAFETEYLGLVDRLALQQANHLTPEGLISSVFDQYSMQQLHRLCVEHGLAPGYLHPEESLVAIPREPINIERILYVVPTLIESIREALESAHRAISGRFRQPVVCS